MRPAALLLTAALLLPGAEDTAPTCEALRGYVYRIRILDPAGATAGFGSSFFVSEDGLLLTALHLFEDAPGAAGAVVEVDGGARRLDCPVTEVLSYSRPLDFLLARVGPGSYKLKAPPLARSAEAGSPVRGFRVVPPPPPGFPTSDGIYCSQGEVALVAAPEIRIRGELFFIPGSSGSPVFDSRGRAISMAIDMTNWNPPGEQPDWTFTSLPIARALDAPRLAPPLSVNRLCAILRR